VVFTGGIPTLNVISAGGTGKVVTDTSGVITTIVEKGGGGSRRIMWRQIQ
jgi:type IV pilus assembly protein PilY1